MVSVLAAQRVRAIKTEGGRKNLENQYAIEMLNITKKFPGIIANDNITLQLKKGEIHALLGENGAGKSTLMKCLFGIYSKDAGHIYLDGKEIDFKSSREALDNGVAMVHQELNQALKRTVMDNIWLGRYPLVKKGLPFVSDKQSYNDTKKVFDDLGINVNPRTVMSTMPVSQRQMVEIAKAVSFNSKVIVFDEPTSSLTETEVEHLFRIINMLRDRGMGIIYISHKMAEIKRISDTLHGTAPELIRHYIEIRGVGVIDVQQLFGMGSVQFDTELDLVVQLEKWVDGKFYDRLGLGEEMYSILGVKLPYMIIPVRPGRNLAGIVEIATMKNRQMKYGYNAARDFVTQFDSKMDAMVKESREKQ